MMSRCNSCGSENLAGITMPAGPEVWQPAKKEISLRSCGSAKCCAMIAVLSAVILFLMAVYLPMLFDSMLSKRLRESLMLDSPSALGMPMFRSNANSDDGVLFKLYAHTITNPTQFKYDGAKPEIDTVGPFVYKVVLENHNLTWSQNGEVLSYRTWRKFVFLPELSFGDPKQTYIEMLNFPMLFAFYAFVAKYPKFLHPGLFELAYRGASTDLATVNRSVHDLLFGYHDDRLNSDGATTNDLVRLLPPEFLASALSFFHQNSHAPNFPGLMPNMTTRDDFEKNADAYSIHTGKFIPDLIRSIAAFDGKDHVEICTPEKEGSPAKICSPLWDSPRANAVGGSDGGFFPAASIAHGSELPVWMLALKTQMYLTPWKDATMEDIETVQYRLRSDTFDNATMNPYNSAYGMFGSSGLFNYSRITHGFPMFISQPNFLQGDQNLRDGVVGLPMPDEERDALLNVYLHTATGAPVSYIQKLQFNAMMQPLQGTGVLSHIRTTVLPLYRAEFHEKLSAEHRRMFAQCDFAKQTVKVVHFASFGLAIVTILIGLVSGFIHIKRTRLIELKKRRSGLYQVLMLESGDLQEHYINTWIDRDHALRHPHLQKAVLLTFVIGFLINIGAESFLHHYGPEVGIFKPLTPGKYSAFTSFAPDSLVNAFLSTLGALHEAKYAVEMGFFPTVYWPRLRYPERVPTDANGRRRFDVLYTSLGPLRKVEHPLYCCLVATLWIGFLFGLPVLTFGIILRYGFHIRALSSTGFSLFKSAYLAFASAAMFIPIYLQKTSSKLAPLQPYLDSHDPYETPRTPSGCRIPSGFRQSNNSRDGLRSSASVVSFADEQEAIDSLNYQNTALRGSRDSDDSTTSSGASPTSPMSDLSHVPLLEE